MKLFTVTALLTLSNFAYADRAEFCAGFAEGYKSIKGNIALVPICPVKPVKPVNSTDFCEGIKAGMRAARRG